MTITTNPAATSINTSSTRSIGRLLGSAAAALALLGSIPTAAAAQADSFVSCIPSEFVTCTGVDVPEEPNPFVVVDGLVFCSLDLNGQNPCPTEDPEPETPFEGPGDLVNCGLDINHQDPCDEEEPEPENPFTGPGDLVACGLDDEGQNTCPPGEDGGEGEGEEGGGGAGIDEPVEGTPDFTG